MTKPLRANFSKQDQWDTRRVYRSTYLEADNDFFDDDPEGLEEARAHAVARRRDVYREYRTYHWVRRIVNGRDASDWVDELDHVELVWKNPDAKE